MELGMTQPQADAVDYRGTDEGSQLAGNASLWTDGDLETNTEFGSSGFNAFPGGYRETNSIFFYIGNLGGWWSSSEINVATAWTRGLNYDNADVYRSNFNKKAGFSVRVVRD